MGLKVALTGKYIKAVGRELIILLLPGRVYRGHALSAGTLTVAPGFHPGGRHLNRRTGISPWRPAPQSQDRDFTLEAGTPIAGPGFHPGGRHPGNIF